MTNTQSPAPGVAAILRDLLAEPDRTLQQRPEMRARIVATLQANAAAVPVAVAEVVPEYNTHKECYEGTRIDPMEGYEDLPLGTLLYTAPPLPAQVQAADLSDERADEIANACYRELLPKGYNGGMGGQTWDRALVRAAIASRTPAPGMAPQRLIEAARTFLTLNNACAGAEQLEAALNECGAPGMAGGAGAEQLLHMLKSCRGSVKAELSRYRQMLLKPAEGDHSRAAKEQEVNRLFNLLDAIDAIPDDAAPHPAPAPRAAGADPVKEKFEKDVAFWMERGHTREQAETEVRYRANRSAIKAVFRASGRAGS